MTQTTKTAKRPIGCVRVLAIISAIVILLTLRACFLRPATNYTGSHFNRGRNAAWLGVEWVMEPHTIEEIRALANDLRTRQITTIFVYVSYLKPNGIFNPTYDHAREFVSDLRQAAPELDVQAWLGVPVKAPPGYPLSSGYIDLADDQIQNTIVEFSRLVVNDLGFNGVHLDSEPILTGNVAMLALLDKVRAALGPQVRLSIATSEITPFFPEADLIVNRWFTWRADYYREIAKRVDQIAVMTYDSHAPFGFWYEMWMHHQVLNLTNSLSDTSAQIFMGVPTSEEHSTSHDPAAENMATGLRGLLAGLNDLDAKPDKVTGVAIYPYWETSDDEWTTYREVWLGQSEQ